MFAVSKNMRMFVVPNSESRTGSRITYESAILKRGSLSDDSTSVGSRCLAKHKGDSASFVIHTTNFFQKMPNSEKVSGAVKNSTRTAPITPYSRLKSEEREKSQGLFKVKFYGVGHWLPSADTSTNPHRADIYFTDNYQASSAFEAAGMAIDAVQKQHPQYDIVLRSIKCSLLNPAAR